MNHKSLQYASEVRKQLTEICDSLGISTERDPSNTNIDQVIRRSSASSECKLRFQVLIAFSFIAFMLPLHRSVSTTKIRKCLITGLFNNIAELQQRDNHYMVLASRQRAMIHPSSVLSGFHANLNGFSSTNGNGIVSSTGSKMKDGLNQKPGLVIFSEIVQTTQVYLRTVTRIEPEWIDEVAPECGLANRLNNNRL